MKSTENPVFDAELVNRAKDLVLLGKKKKGLLEHKEVVNYVSDNKDADSLSNQSIAIQKSF